MGGCNSTKFDPCYDKEGDIDKDTKRVNLTRIGARVDKVHVDGLQRTNDDLVRGLIREIFVSKNFEEVVHNAHRIRKKLEDLGCFSSVGVFIDASSGPGSTANGFEVTFNVRELNRLIGGVTTAVGNNEGSLVIGMKSPNVWGNGERLQLEYTYGSRRTNHLFLTAIKPFRPSYNADLSGSLFAKTSDWPWSHYRLVERGALCDLSFNSLVDYVKHNLQYEFTWREVGVPAKNASFVVREEAGHTLKSAVRHIMSFDNRDGKIFPTCGGFCTWTTELAGIVLGDVGFLKNDGYFQINASVPNVKDLSFQGVLQCGFMNDLFEEKEYHVEDKCFAGGPLSIRGFSQRGVGPREGGSAVGGNVYWALGAHVFVPLPFKPDKETFLDFLRLHAFVNAGNCTELELEDGDEWSDIFDKMFESFRLSYGAGIAGRFGQMARIELNYVIPLKYERSDGLAPGFQFGVGLKFL